MSRWPEARYTTLEGHKLRFFYCCWTFCAWPDIAPSGWEAVERCNKCPVRRRLDNNHKRP